MYGLPVSLQILVKVLLRMKCGKSNEDVDETLKQHEVKLSAVFDSRPHFLFYCMSVTVLNWFKVLSGHFVCSVHFIGLNCIGFQPSDK